MTTRAQMSEATKYEGGHTDLMRAALEGKTEAVKALLESGADVNAKDDEGRTALMFAVTNMQTDSVKALLEHGADVNVRANDGADVSGRFIETGKTALMLAKEKGYTEIASLLQAAGAKE